MPAELLTFTLGRDSSIITITASTSGCRLIFDILKRSVQFVRFKSIFTVLKLYRMYFLKYEFIARIHNDPMPVRINIHNW